MYVALAPRHRRQLPIEACSASHCLTPFEPWQARLMKISRQHAQRVGFEAAHAGLVELAPNDDDRRIVQLLLTERGRAEIARARQQRGTWIARVLLGLDIPRLLGATHVVRVIRQRLAQAERERRDRRRT